MGRTDKFTVLARTRTVYQMILDGWTRSQIVQYITNLWSISTRAADHYIARASKEILNNAKKEQEELFAEHLAARRQLRRDAKQAQDLRLIADLLRDEAKLLGLYPAERREIDVPSGRAFPVTIVEVVRDPDDDKDLAE